MRGALALTGLALLAACNREPSFDERYESQSEKIGAMARNMEQELTEQLNASTAAGQGDPAVPPVNGAD